MKKRKFGYTPMLWDGKYWHEAYGYLGSYYLSYERARFEINFLMDQFPGKYQEWSIWWNEYEDGFQVGEDVVIAQSKGAPQ